MVVNSIIEIAHKRVPPIQLSRQAMQRVNVLPRARVVNISKDEMRRQEAIAEARNSAKFVRADLKSAVNVLSAANAENDRLAKRVKELESEVLFTRKELESEIARLSKKLLDKESECNVLSKALDGLKSEAPAPAAPAEPAKPAPQVITGKCKKNKGKKNKFEAPVQAAAGVQESANAVGELQQS